MTAARLGQPGAGKAPLQIGVIADARNEQRWFRVDGSVGDEEALCLAAGMNAFLRKPITGAMLDECLGRVTSASSKIGAAQEVCDATVHDDQQS